MADTASQNTKATPVPDPLTHLEATGENRDVLEALSRMIERAGLGVGDRLPTEVEIAKKLDVGRSKVREALIAWQNMGIVIRNKKAGTRLAVEVASNSIHMPVTLKLEAESLLRTHAVRRPLEIETARLASEHRTEKDCKLIMARVRELLALYEADEDWRQADFKFHGALQAACGNPLFGQLIQQIQKSYSKVYEAPFGQPHLGQASIPLHLPLAQAVIAGNGADAMRISEKIMDMVEAEIRQVVEAQNV